MTLTSPHFTPVSLAGAFNAHRTELDSRLATPPGHGDADGAVTIRGIPFLFGRHADQSDVVVLDREEVAIGLDGAVATYVVFVHVVEDASERVSGGWPSDDTHGDRLGGVVSEYTLEYADGERFATPILRRFAIQQARYAWGSAPFACVPAGEDRVLRAPEESLARGEVPATLSATRAGGAHSAGLDGGNLWLYALPSPRPEAALVAVTCRPGDERSAVYGVALTTVQSHPLRPGPRRTLRLLLPDAVALDEYGELDPADVEVDLGVVISARARLEYDERRWASADSLVHPARSTTEALVEVAAHPQAIVRLGNHFHPLDGLAGGLEVPAAQRPVRLRFSDSDSGEPVAVRLHLHGPAGEYLPPRGHHRVVSRLWHDDEYAELALGDHQYAYVDGECVADLPLGRVAIEISRGLEITPVRTVVEVTGETEELAFALERVLRWRERGWVTADTHVHFLSPQTALLEGRAEGVNVVNLLASQWGELFTNVGDFDGRTTFGADDLGGRGEFLVRVGSENRMPALGHISLLGYGSPLIGPLCTGGPDESAFGDPLAVSMAEWARRCLDQGGLVVLPHAPEPQLERAADVVLGLVNAIELMHFNPLAPDAHDFGPPLSPYGLADWYRYLNLGYHVPLVAGSDKMSAASLLGGIRTYARLGAEELSYDAWMDAIRRGDTFVTVGPLVELAVEGARPGASLALPAGGGTINVEWTVESLRAPLSAVEVVAGGETVHAVDAAGGLSSRGAVTLPVTRSTWIALRVRASTHGTADDIAAHTSAVVALVDGQELFAEMDSLAVLDQIQGALAYVDTIAPRADVQRFRALRATLESAYERLHRRLHAAGLYHRHPLHDPSEPHEH
ncbi:MAG: CehA/McbA family metallohydrolase [Gaiellales bacterium]